LAGGKERREVGCAFEGCGTKFMRMLFWKWKFQNLNENDENDENCSNAQIH
jgi:hypothetical protein